MKIKVNNEAIGFASRYIGNIYNVIDENEYVFILEMIKYMSDDIEKEYPIEAHESIRKDWCEIVDYSPMVSEFVKPEGNFTPMPDEMCW